MERKLKSVSGEEVTFKGYKIGELPKSFNKDQSRWFNESGITWVEKIDGFWNYV